MKVTVNKNLNRVFMTADHHLGHKNIIEFCNRPYADVAEMDMALIDNWNEVVRPQDWVIHLGDFTLSNKREAQQYFSRLNGDICMLAYPWHHDGNWNRTSLPLDVYRPRTSDVFKSKSGFPVRMWQPLAVLEIPALGKDGYPLAITLCHYPMAVWDRKHYGAWHLHGHSHGNYQYTAEGNYGKVALDVGVDCHNFAPVSLAQISFMLLGKDTE